MSTKSKEQHNDGDYILLNTKVSPHFAETFTRVCEKKGLNVYRVLQMMAETFVRYTDDQHNLSQEMELLMSMFEHMVGWNEAFNLADITAEKQIEEAIYFLTAKNKVGSRAVMVRRPFFGDWSETCNVQTIFSRIIELLTPERHRRMMALAEEMECNGIVELLDVLIDEHTRENILSSYRSDFEDASRAENGKVVQYGTRTKRVKHNSPDMFNQEINK